MTAQRSRLETLLLRDRLGPLAGLAGATALAWLWLAPMALDMGGSMTGAAQWMAAAEWDLRYALLTFLMWAVMMVGMMLPSAAPMILVYGPVSRSAGARGNLPLFTLGYLAAWTGFSALATAAQWGLSHAALLSPMLQSESGLLSGALLILAGLYEWSQLKNLCLMQCRSPAHTLAQLWRPGPLGALRMGAVHGLYCVGCCWALMALLFVGGVMSLAWIIGLGLFVLAEKALPIGDRLGRWAAPVLLLAGAFLVATSTFQNAGPG
jgi:predicted metal-binding membrane protein